MMRAQLAITVTVLTLASSLRRAGGGATLRTVSQSPVGQRDVARDVRIIRVLFYPVCVGGGIGLLAGGLLGALVGAGAMAAVALVMYRVFAGTAADALSGALLPDTRGGAGAAYSHIEALEASGDIDGALAAWEGAIAVSADAVGARVNAADLYARSGKNVVRAIELFRAVQNHANAPDEVQRYATQRLIDLYLGPRGERGRALVELRRIAERWPGTPEADGARRAIAQIKSETN